MRAGETSNILGLQYSPAEVNLPTNYPTIVTSLGESLHPNQFALYIAAAGSKDVDNEVHCSLLMGKSRVVPIKPTTIPRLELTAAVVAARQHHQIQQELDWTLSKVEFWTDSTCILQYINNEAGRFKTFVANRIEAIHGISKPSQWGYVNTEANSAVDQWS